MNQNPQAKVEFISPSKLESFRRCPRRFRDEKFTESPATKFGGCVHAGLAEFFRGHNFWDGYNEAAKLAGVGEDYRARAEKCYLAVRESERLNINPDSIVTIESEDGEVSFNFKDGKKTFFQVEVVPGVWGLRGGMDFVDVMEDGTFRIIDWKTGLTEQEDDLQLTCYALAAYLKYQVSQIEVAFFGLEKGGAYRSTRWDEESLKSAATYLDGLASAFLAAHKDKNNPENFPEIPNKFCDYCSLKSKCAAFNQQVAAPPNPQLYEIEAKIENLPAIMEAFEKITAIKKAAESFEKDLNEKRKALLREHGPQKINGRLVKAIEYTTGYDYQVGEIFVKAQELIGRPPFEILKFDSGAFGDLCKSLPDQKKALEALVKELRTPAGKSVKVTASIAKDGDATEAVA
jgi:RecB family exonuclease